MIHINKTITAGIVSLAVLGTVTFAGASHVQAMDGEGRTSLIQKIVAKFGLKTEDVQAVFDEHRNEMKTLMGAKLEERLAQLVSKGKITEAQKKLILAKHTELQNGREATKEALKNKPPEERKAAMEQQKAELEKWAQENGIDRSYLFGGFGFKGGRMHWRHN